MNKWINLISEVNTPTKFSDLEIISKQNYKKYTQNLTPKWLKNRIILKFLFKILSHAETAMKLITINHKLKKQSQLS